MSEKYIYLVFSKTGTWLSRILSFLSETKYIHASISLDFSFRKMYSFGRTNPNNPFSGGFANESLYDGVYKKFAGSECLIYRVRITQEQYDSLIQEISFFINEKEKYKYNFIGLFGILLNMPIKRKNHYFCSQFVSEVLIKSGIYQSDKSPELIKTNELLLIENMELVYQGFANQYYLLKLSYGYN